MSINTATLVGRLCADPSLRYTPQGKAVCDFTLAVDRGGKDVPADFVDCVCWEKTAEAVANHTGKGAQVAVTGRIQTRTYEAKDGSKRKVVEVVAHQVKFLSRPKGQGGPAPAETAPAQDYDEVTF